MKAAYDTNVDGAARKRDSKRKRICGCFRLQNRHVSDVEEHTPFFFMIPALDTKRVRGHGYREESELEKVSAFQFTVADRYLSFTRRRRDAQNV
jgi:hypothetical protein